MHCVWIDSYFGWGSRSVFSCSVPALVASETLSFALFCFVQSVCLQLVWRVRTQKNVGSKNRKNLWCEAAGSMCGLGCRLGGEQGAKKHQPTQKKNHFFNFLVALLVDFIRTIGLNLILCQSPSFPCFPALWNNDNGNYKIACLFKWTLTEITQRIPSLFYILLIFLCVAWRMSVLSCCHTGLDEERPLCCCGSDIKVCSCSHRFHLQSLCH